MLIVTTAAKEYLVALGERANLSHRDMALRVVKGPLGQLGLLPDVQRPDDHVVEHKGTKALLVGREEERPLRAAVMDAVPTSGGFGLVVRSWVGRAELARIRRRETAATGLGRAPELAPPEGEGEQQWHVHEERPAAIAAGQADHLPDAAQIGICHGGLPSEKIRP